MSDFGFLMENIVGRGVKTLLFCLLAPINLVFSFKKHVLNLTVCMITASIFVIRLNMRCIANLIDVIVLILFIHYLSKIGQNKGVSDKESIEELIEKKVNT